MSKGLRTAAWIAVADRLEGAPRQLRRRWSDEFKAQVVTEALEPGVSPTAGRAPESRRLCYGTTPSERPQRAAYAEQPDVGYGRPR
ncbi:transposase [Bradyrhizobium septentrionale]|nr:transposase [Bradyrhizobium septentrionale]UGY17333.1 transposase [Bradyrhizobium septentrionale]